MWGALWDPTKCTPSLSQEKLLAHLLAWQRLARTQRPWENGWAPNLPNREPRRVLMSQSLPSGLDMLCLRFIQFLPQFCRAGVLLGAQKGRGGWGDWVPSLRSHPGQWASQGGSLSPAQAPQWPSVHSALRWGFLHPPPREGSSHRPYKASVVSFWGQFLVIAFLFAF